MASGKLWRVGKHSFLEIVECSESSSINKAVLNSKRVLDLQRIYLERKETKTLWRHGVEAWRLLTVLEVLADRHESQEFAGRRRLKA